MLSVVGYHIYPRFVPGGFIGVDIFFVISGFLISSLINKALIKHFSFSEFYIRRIKRIFPALTLVLIVVLILGWFMLYPTEYASLGWHAFSAVGFFTNFVFWSESGYFDTDALRKPLLHL